jgi:hypothetical protein
MKRRVALWLAGIGGLPVVGLACGSRTGLEVDVVSLAGADASMAGTDAGRAHRAPADASLPVDAAADAPADGVAPAAACSVDAQPPGTAYWAVQGGDPTSGQQSIVLPPSIATGPDGSLVAVGTFTGTLQIEGVTLSSTLDVNASPGLNPDPSADIYVAKFDPAGRLVFAKSFGDPGAQWARGVAVDADGNIVLTGYFASTVNFGGSDTLSTGVSTSVASQSPDKMFLAKLDPNGNYLWSRAFGQADLTEYSVDGTSFGNPSAFGMNVSVNAAGDVVASGFFVGTIDFTGANGGGPGALTSSGKDAFVAELTGDGDYVFAHSFGAGGSTQAAMTQAIGPDGSILLGGTFSGGIDFTGAGGADGAMLVSPRGCGSETPMTAGFVAKLDAAGHYVWEKELPGSNTTLVSYLAVDSQGDVLASGAFTGISDLADAGAPADAGPGLLPGPDGGSACATGFSNGLWLGFLAEFDGYGARRWSVPVGVPGLSGAGAPIAFDGPGDILLGYSRESDPIPRVAYASKLDPRGNTLWSRTFGAAGVSFPTGIAVGPCRDELFLGGRLGGQSTMTFEGIDGGVVLLDNGDAGVVDLFLARLAQ